MIFEMFVHGSGMARKNLFFVAIPEPPPNLRFCES